MRSCLLLFNWMALFQSRGSCESQTLKDTREVFGSLVGRTHFSWMFIFEPPDFLGDFVAGLFFLLLEGKRAQTNPPGKFPGKMLQMLYNKNPRPISAEGQAKKFGGQSTMKNAVQIARNFRRAPDYSSNLCLPKI